MKTQTKRQPRYWRIDGCDAEHGELFVDETVSVSGTRSCCLTTSNATGAQMTQTMGAYEYRGKRLKFSAQIKTEDVTGEAGIFLYVLDAQPAMIMVDTRPGQAVSGSNEWTPMEIVIDIPQEARYINFGASIRNGTGRLWMDNLEITLVELSYAVTENGGNVSTLDGPSNFDFKHRKTESDVERPFLWCFYDNAKNASVEESLNALETIDGRVAFAMRSNAEMLSKYGDLSSRASYLSQRFNCVRWRGKRVKFCAEIKYEEVGDWCGLLMTVLGARGQTLAYTTMYGRDLQGDSDWQRHSVVLEVPLIASAITVSATLHGSGKVYFANLSFEEVSSEEQTTDMETKPKNLAFVDLL